MDPVDEYQFPFDPASLLPFSKELLPHDPEATVLPPTPKAKVLLDVMNEEARLI